MGGAFGGAATGGVVRVGMMGMMETFVAPKAMEVATKVTVGIKTFVCDASTLRLVAGLVRSIRIAYPTLRILIANDGPLRLADEIFVKEDDGVQVISVPDNSGISYGRNRMVNATTTQYFLLLDDDHIFDVDVDVAKIVSSADLTDFDIIGMRVRNLPGIAELESENILIPRYIANVTSFQNREVTLCVWNENAGPPVQNMTTPLRVDVLHNAFLARTSVLKQHPWRNELKVNEHMTFFLDARKAGIKIGYLPSVFVHHRPRRRSTCYERVRFREDIYERLLDYKDSFKWTPNCYRSFVTYATEHMKAQPSPVR